MQLSHCGDVQMIVMIVADDDKVDARQPRVVELKGRSDESPAYESSHSLRSCLL